MTSKIAIILLALALSGYTHATNATGDKESNLGAKAKKIELPVPDYSVPPNQLVLSDYFVSRTTINASKLFNWGTDLLWADLAGTDVRILRFLSEFLANMLIFVEISKACKKEDSNKYRRISLNRLLILQHFTQHELDWRLYTLAATELNVVRAINDPEEKKSTFFLSPMFWFAHYAFCNYLFRGRRETIIPQMWWGRVAYLPYLWLGTSDSYHLDSYISYRDKTALIGLSTNWDKYNLFCKTDKFYSCKRCILDIEAGVGFAFEPGAWGFLIGLQGNFPLREHCLLNIALSYKTPGFIEGITAEDGVILSGGIMMH